MKIFDLLQWGITVLVLASVLPLLFFFLAPYIFSSLPIVPMTADEANTHHELWSRFQLYHPEGYSPSNLRPYFHGYYFKSVSKNRQHTISIIPGVMLSDDSADTKAALKSPYATESASHSFLMVFHSHKQCLSCPAHATYFRAVFAVDAYQSQAQALNTTIHADVQHFDGSYSGLSIDVEGDTVAGEPFALKGFLSFAGVTPWPVSWLSPGVMGPTAFVAKEDIHGVLSMDHSLDGVLTLNGEELEFTGGRGYIETDMGVHFPAGWVWFQCNSFERSSGASLSLAVARMPLLNFHITGFLAGLLVADGTGAGELHRWASYTGATLSQLDVEDKRVHITFTDRFKELRVKVDRSTCGHLDAPATGHHHAKPEWQASLHGPRAGGMKPFVKESLCSHANVVLVDTDTQDVLFEGHCTNAGLEVNGEGL